MTDAPSETWDLRGRSIRVTSLDKLYWPDDGLTKGALLAYYRAVAPVMLPYLAKRPMTFVVHPEGIDDPGYYRRARPKNAPPWLRAARYEPESRSGTLEAPLVDDEAGLIWYANRGAIEFHIWLSREDELAMPDWAVFDLDPGEQVGFSRVLEAALAVRTALSEQGINCLPKTSGGSGIHLFVPLEPVHSFDRVRQWVLDVTEQLANERPDVIAVASGATHEGSVVTIDHAQNSIARNTAAPYTARARPGATVSAPLSWDEVELGTIRPGHFTIETMPRRIEELGDLWASAHHAQRLPARPDSDPGRN